jgi:amino acid transporter
VAEAFQTMLSLAVVLQLIPFLYIFIALLKIGAAPPDGKGRYSKPVLLLSGASGLMTTTLGIILVFFPAQQIKSLWIYEVKMLAGTLFFIGLAWFFFFVYGSRKTAPATRPA